MRYEICDGRQETGDRSQELDKEKGKRKKEKGKSIGQIERCDMRSCECEC